MVWVRTHTKQKWSVLCRREGSPNTSAPKMKYNYFVADVGAPRSPLLFCCSFVALFRGPTWLLVPTACLRARCHRRFNDYVWPCSLCCAPHSAPDPKNVSTTFDLVRVCARASVPCLWCAFFPFGHFIWAMLLDSLDTHSPLFSASRSLRWCAGAAMRMGAGTVQIGAFVCSSALLGCWTDGREERALVNRPTRTTHGPSRPSQRLKYKYYKSVFSIIMWYSYIDKCACSFDECRSRACLINFRRVRVTHHYALHFFSSFSLSIWLALRWAFPARNSLRWLECSLCWRLRFHEWIKCEWKRMMFSEEFEFGFNDV